MKPLRRSIYGRWIGGVCAGIADYLGIDPTVIRLIWALLFFCGGTGLLAYVICWIGIPEESYTDSGSDRRLT